MRTAPDLELFSTFGELLAYLRKRARLTQEELGRAVGYSREHISRLEKNQRQPDVPTIAALFVPALRMPPDSQLAARLLKLAASANLAPLEAPPSRRRRRRSPAARAIFSHDESSRAGGFLPMPLLPLIDRVRELDALRALLRKTSVRLLTLLGPPGVGKTRLALQVAWQMTPDLQDGARFLDLTPVLDAANLAVSIQQALGLGSPTDRAPGGGLRFLQEYLRRKQMLLVLDNFEHLLPAAPLVADLLSAAPHIKVLVTSRSALQLYGEHEFPLEPLPVPDLTRLSSPDKLAQIPAVALFVERARAVQPDFELTTENAPAVSAICAGLDGLPLALELAAAQLRFLLPQELADRLDSRLATLTRGARNLPPRQQTLRRAIEWSHNLLPPHARQAFAELSVFRGGFDRPAAERVCARPDLATLVESSLVQVRHDMAAGTVPGVSRFGMLETIREFALEQLKQGGEEIHVHEKHARFYLDLAEQAEPHLFTQEQKPWIRRLDLEHDNLRAALEWLLETNLPRTGSRATGRASRRWRNQAALRLCVALYKFWRYRGLLLDGYHWTTLALDADARTGSHVPLRLRARALWGLGLISALLGKDREAAAQLRASLNLWKREQDAGGVADALTALGTLANQQGDPERAIVLQQQALKLYKEHGDLSGMKYAYNQLGESLRRQGDYETSGKQYEASRLLSEQLGNPRALAVAQVNLAQTERARGNDAAARELLDTGLSFFLEIGDSINVANCLIQLAALTTKTGSPLRWRAAAQILGYAENLLQETGGQLWAADRAEYLRVLDSCRAAIGERVLLTEQENGRALNLDQVLAFTR